MDRQRCFFGKQVPDIKSSRKYIAKYGCDRSARDIPAKPKDHYRVKDNINQVADDHSHHGDLRVSFCTDNVAKAVADNQKRNCGRYDAQVL